MEKVLHFKGEDVMEKMEEKVLGAMKKAGKPLRPGDLAKIMGEDNKAISKVMSDLKKQGKVISPKRCYYAPADS